MYAGKSAAGSTPSSRTSPAVNGETVRTASARRSAAAATASPSPPTTRREDEPYSRVDVRQSPCTSTMTRAGTRARRRASSAAAPSYGVWQTTACGRKSRSIAAVRHGSPSQNAIPSKRRGRSGGTSENVSSFVSEPAAADASTRTSISSRSASNFAATVGDGGRR